MENKVRLCYVYGANVVFENVQFDWNLVVCFFILTFSLKAMTKTQFIKNRESHLKYLYTHILFNI